MFQKMFQKKNRSLLAIDLAPDAVRILDLALRGPTPHISALATATLPDGTLDTLPQRHLAALESLLAAHPISARHCVASVPTTLVATRSVLIDPARPQSPEDQIRQTLQNVVTYDLRDLVFDYWNVADAAAKNRSHEVLVVATQRSVLHAYLDGFKKLRLTCTHLDAAPCALASLIAKLVPQQDGMIGAVALGESMGYFAIVEKQRVLFWRPFELPPPKNGQPMGLERVGDEISKCVSHMAGTLHFDGMTDVYVFGHGAHDPGFASYLTTRFDLKIKAPSPFDSIGHDRLPPDLRDTLQPAAATLYATALGLALQPPGGSHG